VRLLTEFHDRLHTSLTWSTEVPLPNPGDQRTWDAMLRGDGWRCRAEAELNPIDGQAVIRRVTLKQRDGLVDGIILLMPDTRQTRAFRREFTGLLAGDFPVPGRLALRRLASGLNPGRNTIVIL
jgi:hypothetical protein